MIAHGSGPVLVVPHAEHEAVVVQQLGVAFEIGVGAVVEDVSGGLRPFDEVPLPAVEEPGQRPAEGDAMPLQAAAAVVGVEAVPAPVVVGVVGIRGQLEEDAGVGGARASDDEEAPALGGAPPPAHELAPLVLGAQRELVVAAAPVVGYFQLTGDRPAAAMGRGVFRDRMARSRQPVLPPYDLAAGTDPRHFQRVRRGAGRHVEANRVPRLVAQLIGVSLDDNHAGLLRFRPQCETPRSGEPSRTRGYQPYNRCASGDDHARAATWPSPSSYSGCTSLNCIN